MISFENEIFLV